ncbi:MAG: hypothetical protein ACMG6S_05415 [Byssovorax sp.]
MERSEACRRELDGGHDPPRLEADQKDARVLEPLAHRDAVKPSGLSVPRGVALWVDSSNDHVTSRGNGGAEQD